MNYMKSSKPNQQLGFKQFSRGLCEMHYEILQASRESQVGVPNSATGDKSAQISKRNG